jgi:hypothetical protein
MYLRDDDATAHKAASVTGIDVFSTRPLSPQNNADETQQQPSQTVIHNSEHNKRRRVGPPHHADNANIKTPQFRKAPLAPKRFKSSYICFFVAKQGEIKAELGPSSNVASVSRRSAELWKSLSTTERAYWDGVADKDKVRYMNEKEVYTGPWQVPYKRAKKE